MQSTKYIPIPTRPPSRMNPLNIAILDVQRPKVERFFNTGSLVLSAYDTSGAIPCPHCIDLKALVQVMRQEFEPSADLNPYAEWDEKTGYKGFLSRLYAHYDNWKVANLKTTA